MPKGVEIDALDPESDLDDELFRDLEAFVLVPDWNESISRVDAIQFLLEEWTDLPPKGLAPWRSRHGDEELRLDYARDGTLRRARSVKPKRPAGSVPRGLVRSLTQQVLQGTRSIRFAKWFGVSLLVGEWKGLLVDYEKLVGHLLMVHGVRPAALRRDADALTPVHAVLHQRDLASPDDLDAKATD
jgi:hypothetical protein